MNTKPLFAALALSIALSAPAVAQSKKKMDDEKTKKTVDGTTVKTKVADDGKRKLKVKNDSGAKMKAVTEPRETMADMPMAEGVLVGGAMMVPAKDIVDNAAGSSDHTTLVAAVKAAGLVETLKSTGPFTVFAPTNAAFDKLPAGTVNRLLESGMKPQLTRVLTYHVVPGRYLAADLKNDQKLMTVEGEPLMVIRKGDNIMLRDAKGGMATISIANVVSSNGVTHVLDTVLMPAN